VPEERAYLPRLIDRQLESLLSFTPATLITGPRGVGKTTAAARHAGQLVRLDRPREAVAFRADPDAALSHATEPVLLDEWQEVPEVLWAVKRAVDDDPRPGRFLLTGSVRADLDTRGWPGTGRLIRIPVWPLTQRELAHRVSSQGFLQRLIDGVEIAAPGETPDLVGYLERALAGGLPQAVLQTPAQFRPQWYRSYLEQILTTDAGKVGGGVDPERLRRHLLATAATMSTAPALTTVAEAASLDAQTATRYDNLLSAVGVLDLQPAWEPNRLKRLTRRPRRFLTDTGLAAAALGVGVADLLADGDLLGRSLEAFVAAQLRPELELLDPPGRLHHLRDRDGHEVDFIVDLGRRGLIALEIKATASPSARDARQLTWLRSHLGDQVLAGVVLHTGSYLGPLAETSFAAPISCLWQ
jgi:uncharacterized protein